MTEQQRRATVDHGDAVDVRDMLEAHKTMRREFRLAPADVRRTAGGDRRQARRVVDHLRFMLGVLHRHHEGEDRLLWPKLSARVPEELAPIVDVMEGQHEAIGALLDDVDAQLDPWAAHPSAAAGERLADSLTRLSAALEEHLAAEERDVLPLAATHLSVAEWQMLEREGIDALPKSQAAVAFGGLMYEGDPEVIGLMLGRAPAPVRLLVPHIGPRAYARRARRVHGTPTP